MSRASGAEPVGDGPRLSASPTALVLAQACGQGAPLGKVRRLINEGWSGPVC